jgi:hypothetical protein
VIEILRVYRSRHYAKRAGMWPIIKVSGDTVNQWRITADFVDTPGTGC